MDSDTIWRHIDTERAALADLLQGLPESAWATPSLCEDWTVRDVAAHVTFAHARVRDVLGPALRAGFSYNGMIKRAALTSPLTHEQIVATIRGFVGSRRRAPMVSELEPLLDILVRTQDICVPLGIDHPMPPEAAAVAATRVFTLKGPMRLWRLPRGIRLVASDTDWSHGTGPVVEAPIQHLLLGLTGREALSGATQGQTP
jgi:uncharacterized protein (TIGR03083 family)